MKLPGILIAAFLVAMLAYDVYLLNTHGADATFSHLIAGLSRDWPIIPFGFGFVCGHLFWPLASTIKKDENGSPHVQT